MPREKIDKNIYREDNGTITVRYDIYTPERKQKTKRGFKGIREARNFLAEQQHKKNTGEAFDSAKMTLNEYIEYWLTKWCDKKTSAYTVQNYRGYLDNHIKNELGDYKLSKIKASHIQNCIDNIASLSPSSKTLLYNILNSAFNKAVKWKFIPPWQNPMTDVVIETPNKHYKLDEEDAIEKMQVLDEEQIVKLLSLTEKKRWHLLIYVALATGMRRGELAALRWEDIDFKSHTIAVKRAFIYVKGQGHLIKLPKNNKPRVIEINPEDIEVLKYYRNEKLKKNFNKKGYVFVNDQGKPYVPTNMASSCSILINKILGTKIRFHDLRHTHASLLFDNGADLKDVQERLGHSTIAITANIYTHMMSKRKKFVARSIAHVFSKSSTTGEENIVKKS